MGIGELKTNYLQHLQLLYSDFSSHAQEIEAACDFAIHAHTGQVRKYEDVPFVSHPMSVSLIVAERYHDISLIIAALLHDAAEDCEQVEVANIYAKFGDKVGYIVDAVSAEPLYFSTDPSIVYNDKIEKLLAGGLNDIRSVLLKLADREHNLATLEGMNAHKQIRMAFETQAIYEPLKRIIGEGCELEQCKTAFHTYIAKHHLQGPKEIKNHLYNQSFEDFDNDTFNLVYRNTGGITWKIQDKQLFEELINREHFDEKIEILSIEQRSDGGFEAIIRYKYGSIFGGFAGKFTIGDNEFTF